MKKISIIGQGTAGCLTAAHFSRHMPDWEIDWYYDSNKKAQSVGEGSTLSLPHNLYHSINFYYCNYDLIDATPKIGIFKEGWGVDAESFLHSFPPSTSAMHFNAVKLQKFIVEYLKNKVNIIDNNINIKNIDSDYVIDCSGKPESYYDYSKSNYIPVNAAHIVQCYWDHPRFLHTLAIARPYGWVFGIPLQNRCSIGYLFNNNINTIDDIKDDIKNVLVKYNLTESTEINNLNFNNYYKNTNFIDNIAFNGNSSFFLEPLEATSLDLVNLIQRLSYDVINKNKTTDQANFIYNENILQIEAIIMLHYFAGSKYRTTFWEFAQERGRACISSRMIDDPRFRSIVKYSLEIEHRSVEPILQYGVWQSPSFYQNLRGLGVQQQMLNLFL